MSLLSKWRWWRSLVEDKPVTIKNNELIGTSLGPTPEQTVQVLIVDNQAVGLTFNEPVTLILQDPESSRVILDGLTIRPRDWRVGE